MKNTFTRENQKSNKLKKFLTQVAGYTWNDTKRCTPNDVNKLATLGCVILIPPFLGIFSFTFFINSTFSIGKLSMIVGLSWAIIVYIIDRLMIVTMGFEEKPIHHFKKPGTYFRILLAILLALMIAHPLEMQFFKGTIEQELHAQLGTQVNEIEKKYQSKNSLLLNDLDALRESKTRLYNEYIKEWDGTGGSELRGKHEIANRKRKEYSQDSLRLASQIARVDSITIFNTNAMLSEIKDLEDKQARDPVAQLKAIWSVMKSDGVVMVGCILFTLFLLILELIPLFGKITMRLSSLKNVIEHDNKTHESDLQIEKSAFASIQAEKSDLRVFELQRKYWS